MLVFTACVRGRPRRHNDRANAQDAPRTANWSGLYTGVIAGGINRRGEVDGVSAPGFVAMSSSHNQSLGALLGYAWQSGPIILGVEGDWSQQPGTYHDNHLVSLRTRAGWALGNSLLYATAGIGAQDTFRNRGFGNGQSPFQTDRKQYTGLVVGGGLESRLPGNFSLRAEALYFAAGKQRYDYAAGTFSNNGTATSVPAYSADFGYNEAIYRVGLTYHFQGTGDGDVAATGAEAPPTRWSGLYSGLTGGGGNTRGVIDQSYPTYPSFPNTSYHTSSHSLALGAFGGYAWQSGSWVTAVEGDWSRLPGKYDDSDLYTARTRLGWAVGNALVYGTAGVGTENIDISRVLSAVGTYPGGVQKGQQQFTGLIVGGGFEAMLLNNVSLRAEGLYFADGSQHAVLPSVPFTLNGQHLQYVGSTEKQALHQTIYRVGIAYHFD